MGSALTHLPPADQGAISKDPATHLAAVVVNAHRHHRAYAQSSALHVCTGRCTANPA